MSLKISSYTIISYNSLLRFSGNKINCFPRDQSSCSFCYSCYAPVKTHGTLIPLYSYMCVSVNVFSMQLAHIATICDWVIVWELEQEQKMEEGVWE